MIPFRSLKYGRLVVHQKHGPLRPKRIQFLTPRLAARE